MNILLRKTILFVLVIVLAAACFGSILVSADTYISPGVTRETIDFNGSWKFVKGGAIDCNKVQYDDSAWATLDLPHTWNNLDGQDGGSNYYRGTGWYRKHFLIGSEYKNKQLYIQFEGVNTVAEVWINDKYVGKHEGGYATFRFDITAFVEFNKANLIAVKVDNSHNANIPPLSADFTFFGGIYRDVSLIAADKLSVSLMDYGSQGVYVTATNVSKESADISVKVKLTNNYGTYKDVTLKTVISDAENNIVKTLSNKFRLKEKIQTEFVQNTVIENPHLWNGLSDPYMYNVNVEIINNDVCLDSVTVPLGIRYFHVDPNKGFFLNGEYYDLYGVNRHQDRLDKGWAIGKAEHLEDFNLIKELGATAIRLAHYQHAQYFYDLCDANGMVIWAEIPLVNTITKTPEFTENCKQQMTELIRQNYNHPSIMFWGVYNELSIKQGNETDELIKTLNDIVHTEDPVRISTCATNAGHDDASINWHTDITGFNIYYGWYGGNYNDLAWWLDYVQQHFPGKSFALSEYGAGSSIYFHSDNPYSNDHTEEYQSLFHEAYYGAMKTRPFVWGKFIWNMFDFAVDNRDEGDTKGRNDKGLVTYDRKHKKDSFYYYKANWSKDMFVHLCSKNFTERPNKDIEVKAYSNCEEVELRVNGVSMGTKKSDGHIFKWNVSLSNGDNLIEVYTKVNGGTQYYDSCTWAYGKAFDDASKNNSIKININGNVIESDVAPVEFEGTVFVPIRSIFEALNSTVGWDDATQSVVISNDTSEIKLKTGSDIIYVNGNEVKVAVPTRIINSRTMMPVELVNNLLGSGASWDKVSKIIKINY